MQQVDVALYGRLVAHLGTLTLGTLGCTGVYRMLAPNEADLPYILFSQQSDAVRHSFSGVEQGSLLYLIKVVDEGLSASRAANIMSAVNTLLEDKPLSMTGWRTLRIRKDSGIEYVENDEGRMFQHYGALFRIDVAPTS